MKKRFPVPDKRARTGTTLRGRAAAAAAAAWEAQSVEERKARERLRRKWQAQARKLFTRAEMCRAVEIITSARQELHASNLAQSSERSRWDANKSRYRKGLDRELARALPRYREFRTLARAHGRALQGLSQSRRTRVAASGLHVSLGDAVATTATTAQIFSPPYAVFEQWHDGISVDVADRSFVVPAIGHIINDFTFSHDDDGPLITDVLGLTWWGNMRVLAGCGVNYTTPTAGRLRILGELQNFYNRANYSVDDLFGFSEAHLDIQLQLFAAVIRPAKATYHVKTLLHGGIQSFGSDLAYQMPLLDTELPYTIEVTTSESFPANSGLQIVVGATVYFYSEINDMRTHASGLLWSQLKSLTVDMV